MDQPSQAALARGFAHNLAQFQQDRVKVYVTRDVAFNLEKMNELTKTVLGKLGCDGCHSGRIIDYLIVEDFVVNPKTLQVDELIPGRQF